MVRVVLSCVCLWLASPAAEVHAQAVHDHDSEHRAASPPSDALLLEFEEALALIDRVPEVQARVRASQQLRAARSEVSGLPSDLLFSVEAGARFDPTWQAQGRLAASQSFTLANLGSARKGFLAAHADAVESERAGLRLSRRTLVGQTWLRARAAHAALDIAQAELELARSLARASARGAQLAELTRADAADADAYAAEAELGVLSAEGELAQARLDLTQALALSERLADVRGELPPLAAPDANTERALHAHVDDQPALAQLLRQLGVVDARTRELRAAYASQLSLGVALDRTDPNAWAALGLIGFTLPTSQRSRRDAAELEAEKTALQGSATEQRAALHVELERLFHEIHHSSEALQHADTQLLPAVERGLAAREALFRAGEGTVFELILARRNALGLRQRRLGLHNELLTALFRVRELASVAGVAR